MSGSPDICTRSRAILKLCQCIQFLNLEDSGKGAPQGLRGGNETRTGVLCVLRCRPRLPAGPLDSDTLCVSPRISAGLLKARAAWLRKTASDTGGRQGADSREHRLAWLGPGQLSNLL